MLERSDLETCFSGLQDMGLDIIRCQDVTPRATTYYYVRMGSSETDQPDFLAVSENLADDDFARLLLSSAARAVDTKGLSLAPLPQNRYGFPQMVQAPQEYFGYFKGRLDEKIGNLIYCMPCHPCEFTGKESVEEFFLLRRKLVPTLNWNRQVCPKVSLRFDNPKTGSGTIGDSEVYVSQDTLHREIKLLSGAAKGFIEIINYKSQVIEVLSPKLDQYVLILGREDSTRRSIGEDELRKTVDRFLSD